MRRFSLSFLFILAVLCAKAFSQGDPNMPLGPPGDCLEFQFDNVTHSASDYSPIVYSFPPDNGNVASPSTAATLTFFSYNIQSGYSLDCIVDFPNQTAFVASQEFDFAGFQETDISVDNRCNCNMPQLLADATGKNAHFLMVMPWHHGKYGTITLTAFDVLNTSYVYYDVTSINPKLEQRGAMGHLVQPPQLGGKFLWYVNTHLEFSNVDARSLQATQLITWIENTLLPMSPNAMVVVTGDWYAIPGDNSYTVLSSYFDCAWVAFSGSTNLGYTHPSDVPSERFDNIFYKLPADNSLSVTITNYQILATILSDHRPIMATFSFSATTTTTTTTTTTASTASTVSASTTTSSADPPSSATSSSASTSGTSSSASSTSASTTSASTSSASTSSATSSASTSSATSATSATPSASTSSSATSATPSASTSSASTSAASTTSTSSTTASATTTTSGDTTSSASTTGDASTSSVSTSGSEDTNSTTTGVQQGGDSSTSGDPATSGAAHVIISALFVIMTLAAAML